MIRNRWKAGLAAAALAVPLAVLAQQPPQPPAQTPPPQAPAWGQRGFGPGPRWGAPMGPGAHFRQGWGMRRGPGFGMRRGFAPRAPRRPGPGLGLGRAQGPGVARLLQNPQARERLGITAEQAARIQQQESAFVQNRLRTQADLQARRMELEQLMRAENPDRALIDRKMKELSDARLAAEKSAFEHRLAMRNALTPEQKQKLEEWRKELRQNWQQRWQQRPGLGPGRGPGPAGPPNPPAPPQSPAGF